MGLFSKKDGTTFAEDLRAIFSNVGAWLANAVTVIFTRVDELYEQVGDPFVQIVNGIKSFVQQGTVSGNIVDAIVAAIPGTVDDAVLAWFRANVDDILEIWTGIPQSLDNIEDSLQDVIDQIKGLPAKQQAAAYNGLAATMMQRYSDDVKGIILSDTEATTLAQLSYELSKKSQSV